MEKPIHWSQSDTWDLKTRIAELEADIQHLHADSEVDELKARIAELEAENKRLKGRQRIKG